jgi:hypothetical protein
MGDYKEDTSRNFGTILFIILFSLFALTFSGNSVSQTPALSRSSLQYELATGNISIPSDAVVYNAVNIPDLYKNCVSALQNTSLNLFSIPYKILSYNNRTTQNFINIQKTRLIIEPLFLRRSCYPLSPGEKEDLPVLS